MCDKIKVVATVIFKKGKIKSRTQGFFGKFFYILREGFILVLKLLQFNMFELSAMMPALPPGIKPDSHTRKENDRPVSVPNDGREHSPQREQ